MQKIEILRIKSPSDFWIAERDSKSFLDLIHKEIKKESENSDYNQQSGSANQEDTNPSPIVAINDKLSRKWFRAITVAKVNSFSESHNFKCFLIDTGETVVVSKSSCSRIYNKNLHRLPPLAKHCSLFGIEPIK